MTASGRLNYLIFVGLLLSIAFQHVVGLHFYLHNDEKKCFIEELPRETVVIGI